MNESAAMVTKKQRQIYAAKMIFYKDQHILTRLKICFNWAEMIFYWAEMIFYRAKLIF